VSLEITKEQACFGGRQLYAKHESTRCGPMELTVYLPPGEGPFPVVYYLSGLTCTAENFTTKAGAQRVAAEKGLAIVAPDTSPRLEAAPDDHAYDLGKGAGFYVDATEAPWATHYRMYSYVTEELPSVVESALPLSDRRSVFGHSMGGHGALVVALRNPKRYQSVSAFSPIVAPTQVPWGEKAFGAYLGDDRGKWAAYDATELVKQTQLESTILIDQGLADGFLEEQLKPELFEAACAAAGQDVEVRRHEGYDHSYYFIASFVEDHLEHHAKHLT